MRNKEIYEIEERDLKDVKSILLELFNNKITYENIKEFYRICQKNDNVFLYGYYINDKIVGMIFLDIAILPSGKKSNCMEFRSVRTIYKQRNSNKINY